MAIGGGTWATQNKELPGTYINFVSLANAAPALSERGIATMPLELDWGPDNEVFEISSEAFREDSLKLLGYAYTDDHLKGLRDLFLNASTLYAYKLNSDGEKAECEIGALKVTAKYSGIRGNDLSVSVLNDPDRGYDVQIRLGDSKVSEYTKLNNADELYGIDDPYVVFSTAIKEAPAKNIVSVKEPNAEEDLLGKHVGDLQKDIEIVRDGNTAYVSGTLKYVSGYTDFSKGNEAQQEGNYFAIEITDEVTKYALYKNGEKGKDASDKLVIFRVDPDETFGIEWEDKSKSITFDFSRVNLEGPAGSVFRAGDPLTDTARTWLAGGTNGQSDVDSHQKYLDAIESYSYNTMGVVTEDDSVKELYTAFTRRMREEQGIKFQLVLHNSAADYLGVINVKNNITDAGWSAASLVYWVTGAECACPVQSSCEAKRYDGEFAVAAEYTQTELKESIKAGELVFHKVNSDIEILVDINSMVTVTDTCGDIFKENQTIRVIDQLGNDDAILFNTRYRGKIPNTESGRTALWADLVKIRKALLELEAIEDFEDEDVIIGPGDTKKSVVVTDQITVVNAMSKLYITTTVA